MANIRAWTPRWPLRRLEKSAKRGPCVLDVSLVLNVGTIHHGTPLSNFPIFAHIHVFFGIFPKLESTTLI
jgi:hypothetical protein